MGFVDCCEPTDFYDDMVLWRSQYPPAPCRLDGVQVDIPAGDHNTAWMQHSRVFSVPDTLLQMRIPVTVAVFLLKPVK